MGWTQSGEIGAQFLEFRIRSSSKNFEFVKNLQQMIQFCKGWKRSPFTEEKFRCLQALELTWIFHTMCFKNLYQDKRK